MAGQSTLTKLVVSNVTEDMYKRIVATAAALGTSKSEVVRSVLDGRLPELTEIPKLVFRSRSQHDLYEKVMADGQQQK